MAKPTPPPTPEQPLPRFRAQLAAPCDRAPDGDEWLHEIKYDGYRMACFIERGSVRLESRRGQDWTATFPEVVSAARQLPVQTALLDGEVAILMPDGRTSFQALQNVRKRRVGWLVYLAFDLLHLEGRNLAELALEQRKELLQRLLEHGVEARGDEAASVLRYSGHFLAPGPSVLAHVCRLGLEGVISKRRDRPYRPGRGTDWLKTKCMLRQEFVVGGFTEGEGTRQGIGALLIGVYDEQGKLRFAGKVGNGPGFTEAYTSRLRREFAQLEQRPCPFDPPPPALLRRHAHWVRPERVVEVSFADWTEKGAAREPLLLGFRDDKAPSEVRREVARTSRDES